MTDVTLRTFFVVNGPDEDVIEQADRLMEALVDAVDADVFDPAISFDADASVAEVDVSARGENRMDAEAAGLARIAAAMHHVGIPVRELADRRVVELAGV